MKQSRLMSLAESVANVIVGYGVALIRGGIKSLPGNETKDWRGTPRAHFYAGEVTLDPDISLGHHLISD
jgi:hypothetical protein